MTLQEARLFVARFVKGDHSPEEYATFLRWLEKASTVELEVIAEEYEALFGDWSIPPVVPSKEWVDALEAKLDLVDQEGAGAPVVKIDRGRLVRRVGRGAAAAVILAVSVGSYFWYAQQNAKMPVLSDNNTGALSKSFIVPKGGQQQQFVLPDGSKVWLNAATTLRYSLPFEGSSRFVELNGEAYFEVAKDAKLPFRVGMGAAQIEVLGTEFNVQAYGEEPVSRATLISGSVRVIRGKDAALLKPGEQAEIVNGQEGLKVIPGIDPEGISSWRTGIMEFRGDDLRAVMRQIARCYDLGVEFEAGVSNDRLFSGVLSRKSTINQIVSQLEQQQIHCRVVGKNIVVMN